MEVQIRKKDTLWERPYFQLSANSHL